MKIFNSSWSAECCWEGEYSSHTTLDQVTLYIFLFHFFKSFKINHLSFKVLFYLKEFQLPDIVLLARTFCLFFTRLGNCKIAFDYFLDQSKSFLVLIFYFIQKGWATWTLKFSVYLHSKPRAPIIHPALEIWKQFVADSAHFSVP